MVEWSEAPNRVTFRMNDSEGAALLATINENLNDLAPRLIYSDWLEENGRPCEALAWRGMAAACHPFIDFYGYGFGLGYGYGDGYGDGYCYAYGNGYGGGSGDGDAYGDGYGHGYESGVGCGDGDGNWDVLKKQNTWIESHNKIIEGRPMIGKQMLIWCGRGFAWIGQVDEMYAPGCYKLSNAGMLCRTGPDSWMAVASGAPPGITTSTGTPRTASSIPGRNCMGRLSGRGNFPVRT